jgi:arylsulfatase A-like enzyme
VRRRAGRALAILCSLAVGCGGPPPSIVLVTLDTLRRDHVGAYGGGDLTPHLDRLAAGGLVHEAAYTTMPTTGPAHLSLFTGLYPSEHTARRNAETLPARLLERELGARLQRRGYATAAFVSTRLLSRAATGLAGFEIYDAPRGTLRHGRDAVDAALVWLETERRRPVLLWVHVYDPHAPYGTADEKRLAFPVPPERYGWVDPDVYADAEERAAMAERYARGVRAADEALGRLWLGARERIAGPVLFAVVADHGESLAEHLEARGFAYDHGEFLDAESVAIPLVLSGPGVAPGRSAAPASIRDLYTTLLAAAGVRDAEAEAGGRRDLRVASDAARVVRVERRRFVSSVRDPVRAHAVAASDGERLVIVAEEGSVTAGGAGPDAEGLVREARAALAQWGTGETPPAIDAELQRSLRDLGYAE